MTLTTAQLTDLIVGFCTDPRLLTLLTLVFLDLVLGVAAALKTGSFRFDLIGQWYIKNVVPFIISFFALYVVTKVGVSAVAGPLIGDISTYVSAAPAILELITSIRRHVATMATGVVPVPEA